jgi:phosphonate transport system substrate-binding protein
MEKPGAVSRIAVGIASPDPGPTRALLEGFCSALSTASTLRVTSVGVGHYHTLLEAIEKGEVDVAWLPPILAAQATARGQVVPIALPVRNGFCCYSTALFTREESTLHVPRDIAGARAAWVDKQSAAGFLIIRAHLKSLGVDFAKAFGSEQFLGSHSAVARAVMEGDADVGATFVYLDPKSLGAPGHIAPVTAGWGSARVRILAHAGPIPSDVIAVSARTSHALRTQLQRMLVYGQNAAVRQAASALFGAEGFQAPMAEHLRPLTSLLAGLESTVEEPVSTSPRTRR